MPAQVSAEADRQPVLALQAVCKHFQAGKRKVTALQDVSFDVKQGLVTGLIGPDGAGKTTLMRLAAGLLRTDSGVCTVLGRNVAREPLQVQADISYMPQRFGLYEDLTVQENLDLYADLQGVLPEGRAARYRELTKMTGLEPFKKRLAGDLSGGMKQKLGLACTLVRLPRLLLLDEPTVGVDPLSRRELWHIVYSMVEKEGLSVLLSTAYLDEAERCQEVVLMHDGRILDQGEPADFSKRMEGRAFRATSDTLHKRILQEKLSQADGVIDAIIMGGGVRMVTEKVVAAGSENLFSDLPDVQVKAVAPRFEDCFIAMLKTKIESGPPAATLLQAGTSGASAADDEIIVVRDVKRRFGDFYAVKGISFTVRKGEVFGLLGANGAGKSTTFRMLCGLLPASDGTLRVAGQDLRTAAAKARSRLGYMAQRFSLYENLSVFENLRFFSSAYGLAGKIQRSRIDWALNQFEFKDLVDATSGDLPLGYKQRLAMAAALMHSPDILFLDEPTSGVDPLERREFWHRINSLAAQGVTLLVTTHFMEEAEYCDRLVIMSRGTILAEGSPEEIKNRAQSGATAPASMEEAFIALIESTDSQRVST